MELRIRVGAAVDRSMSEAFRPAIRAAEQARDAITRTARQGGQAQSREAQRASRDQERAYAKLVRETERWRQQEVRAAEKAARQQAAAVEKGARDEVRTAEKAARDKARAEAKEIANARREARQRARDELAAIREVDRELARGRGRGRAANDNGRPRRGQESWNDKFLDPHRNAQAAFGLAGAAGRKALGIAMDVASGAGVNLDVGSHVAANVAMETRATDLSNAAYMPGEAGPNGQRVDPRALIEQARQVGQATAMDPSQTLEGLQRFVAKTGDLATGRDVIKDLARYSKATGADLGDMADAAGDVSSALGDVPNKGEAIKSVMRTIAAQGKEGAVEVKDLSTQMAKLGAASSRFTDDRDVVMAQMGAVAQMARSKGGAASATQAATSVSGLAAVFGKGARLDQFKAFGVDIRGADQRVDLRKTILGSLAAASSEKFGGMQNLDRNMAKMFMDASAQRATRGFETVYREAGGGQAGLEAVTKAFDSLVEAQMKETEITESLARSMGTTESQAQQFNNQMGLLADQVKTMVVPALPLLADAAKTATEALKWINTNAIQPLVDKMNGGDTKRQVNAELHALNAGTAVRAIAGKDAADVDEINAANSDAVKAKEELDVQIRKKRAEVAEEDRDFAGVSRPLIQDRANHGDLDAQKYLRDQEALARMEDTQGRLIAGMDGLADKLATRQLRVVIVGDTRPRVVDPNPPTRTPPPGAQPR